MDIEQEVAVTLQARPALTAVQTAEQAQEVAGYLTRIKEVRKKIADFFRGDIDKAHELHKSLLAKMKQVEAGPVAAEAQCKNLLTAWQVAEQTRIRKLQEEADRKAQEEADKKAQAAAIEQAKLDAEAAKRAQEAAKAEGDKKALAEAKREAEEAKARAVALKAGTVQVVAAPVTSVSVWTSAKIAGASLRATWSAEVVDLVALCRWIGTGKNGTMYVQADMPALNKVMIATKGQMVIPGVRAVEKFATASR